MHEIENDTVRQSNKHIIEKDADFHKKISEMRRIQSFFDEFGFLQFGRDYVFVNKIFSLQKLSTSCELTLGNVVFCCECGCIADANTLLRKFRDDLFFYLYIAVCSSIENGTETNQSNSAKDNVNSWLNNTLRNLNITDVLRFIGNSERIKSAVKKYKLQSFFNEIGQRLNNYVHGNGVSFYNQNVIAYGQGELLELMNTLLRDIRFITVAFLFLLTLCLPLSIMSTDYIDYHDMGQTPTEGSQYCVAPFVEQFFKENLELIDDTCIDYLKENTSMNFD